MQRNHNQLGYILVFVLMAIAIAMGVVSYSLSRVSVFSGMSQITIMRAQARQLALSGIVLAQSQLIGEPPKKAKPKPPPTPPSAAGDKKEAPKEPEKKENSPAVKFLINLLEILNQWQTVSFTQARDGVKGSVQLYIASEDGKININELYDFEKNQFIGAQEKKEVPQPEKPAQQTDEKKPSELVEKAKQFKAETPNGRVLLESICEAITKRMGGSLSVADFESFFNQRKKPLDDVTQLFAITNVSSFKNAIFYKLSDDKKEPPFYLMDLFTIATPTSKIDPWLLSDSTRGVMGLSRVKQGKALTLTDEQIQYITPTTAWKWNVDWDKLVKGFYGKDFNGLPKPFVPFFKTQFEPKTFSVLSYGTVGRVTVRYYAIIERIQDEDNEKKTRLIIKRLYQI